MTREGYEQVVIPKVRAALKKHDKIRLYYELGSQFSGVDLGAAWDDLKGGVEHLTQRERMAVVTDAGWISRALNAFRFMMPGQL